MSIECSELTSSPAVVPAQTIVGRAIAKKEAVKVVRSIPPMVYAAATIVTCPVHPNLAYAALSMDS